MEAVQEHTRTRNWRTRLEMPLLVKEMRSHMRGNRMPWLLGAASSISVAVCLLVLYHHWWTLYGVKVYSPRDMATVGHYLFVTLLVTQAALCLFIAPVLTAGSIAGEAKRKSLEMLLLSPLSMMNLAVSKLLSAIGVLLLLLVCTMPVMAVAFLLGGVSLGQVLLSYRLVLAIGIYGGAVGLYYSARTRKITGAVIMAYLVTLLWCIGLPVVGFGICALTPSFFHFSNGIERAKILVAGFSLLDMLFPTLLISAIFCACTRRTMRWWVALLIWLLLTGLLNIWFAMLPHATFGSVDFVLLSFIGNPVIAIMMMILDPISPGIGGRVVRWYLLHFSEITLSMLLALAWAYLIFTAQRLREMRKAAQ